MYAAKFLCDLFLYLQENIQYFLFLKNREYVKA